MIVTEALVVELLDSDSTVDINSDQILRADGGFYMSSLTSA